MPLGRLHLIAEMMNSFNIGIVQVSMCTKVHRVLDIGMDVSNIIGDFEL